MPLFVDRQEEMSELNALLTSVGQDRSEFVIVYGRRRVGKTTLLLQWAEQSGLSFLYWVARREPVEATRQSLARALWRWAYSDIAEPQPPRFDSWELLFEQLARMISDKPIIIFDVSSVPLQSCCAPNGRFLWPDEI